jgi:hypothetical protein
VKLSRIPVYTPFSDRESVQDVSSGTMVHTIGSRIRSWRSSPSANLYTRGVVNQYHRILRHGCRVERGEGNISEWLATQNSRTLRGRLSSGQLRATSDLHPPPRHRQFGRRTKPNISRARTVAGRMHYWRLSAQGGIC